MEPSLVDLEQLSSFEGYLGAMSSRQKHKSENLETLSQLFNSDMLWKKKNQIKKEPKRQRPLLEGNPAPAGDVQLLKGLLHPLALLLLRIR